jgi:hypothetical protein
MIKVGQSKKLIYQITNDSNGIVDLDGYSIQFVLGNNTTQITKKNTEAGGSDSQIKVLDSNKGLLVIYLTRTDTLRLEYNSVYAGSIHLSKESKDIMKNLSFRTEKSVLADNLDLQTSDNWESSTANWETI